MSAGNDVLAGAVVTLQVLKGTSSAMSAVPFLGAVLNSALAIVETIENVRGSRERRINLAKRASDLAEHVEKTCSANLDAVDDALKENLGTLATVFALIQRSIEKLARRRFVKRVVRQGTISDVLDKHLEELNSAWRSFDNACLNALRQQVERQAQHMVTLRKQVEEQTQYAHHQALFDVHQALSRSFETTIHWTWCAAHRTAVYRLEDVKGYRIIDLGPEARTISYY
ncbi:hypothetical protein A0H81_13855 [Grifola frondosa]|uniref:Fungal N-terminal domain-containing protein n=1 Tax=Grifola frondosa TaxID=5627 RepID=A0A1C7LNX8_GRIFR|nr:hypothetical protein A0H81_13855 [Grifola frondosa]